MTNNNNDDLENFDESQYTDLETDLDASYDDPLPDTFSDDSGLDDGMPQDEDFGSDGDWDDQVMDAEDSEQPPPKKKSAFMTYAIIGVVVVGAGIFALTQLGGGSSEAPSPEIVSDSDQAFVSLEGLRDEGAKQDALQSLDAPVAAVDPAPREGFMNEAPPPSLPSGPSLTAVENVSEIIPPAAEALPSAPVELSAPLPADPAVITGLTPVSDFPSVEKIKKADATAKDIAPVLQPVEAPVPNTAELTVLQGKLDVAQTRIESLEKELAAARTVVAPVASSDDALIAELEDKIASLEKKLAESKVKPVEEKRVVAEPEARVSLQPRQAPVAAKPAAAIVWELRGAQPGKALLSRKGAADDVRTVSVGDNVPGLGNIVSIDQTSAGWVVNGSQGRVTQ